MSHFPDNEENALAIPQAASVHTWRATALLPPQGPGIKPSIPTGEWFGYLDRFGKVSQRFKGGPYKGISLRHWHHVDACIVSCLSPRPLFWRRLLFRECRILLGEYYDYEWRWWWCSYRQGASMCRVHSIYARSCFKICTRPRSIILPGTFCIIRPILKINRVDNSQFKFMTFIIMIDEMKKK